MRYIVFIHILSAIVWVGGMIMVRLAVHPSLKELGDEKIPFVLTMLQKMFVCIGVVAAFSLISGIFLMLQNTGLGALAHIKSTILLAMLGVYGIAVWAFMNAKTQYGMQNTSLAKQKLDLISAKLVSLNIAFGILELFLGVILRGY